MRSAELIRAVLPSRKSPGDRTGGILGKSQVGLDPMPLSIVGFFRFPLHFS